MLRKFLDRRRGVRQKLREQEDALLADLRTTLGRLDRPGLRGRARPGSDPELLETRLGGPMVCERGSAPPEDDAGVPLSQLLWVDLRDLPASLGLPGDGWLQLLLATDDLWGCQFPSANGRGFRLLHHPPGTEFERCHSTGHPAGLPLHLADSDAAGCALDWQEVVDRPSPAHHEIARLAFSDLAIRSATVSAEIEAVCEELAEARGRYDVMLLGHGDFTQEDPRSDGDRFAARDLWECLLGFSSSGGSMMWGDAGEAVFLAPAADCHQLRLDRVAYSWDCC